MWDRFYDWIDRHRDGPLLGAFIRFHSKLPWWAVPAMSLTASFLSIISMMLSAGVLAK